MPGVLVECGYINNKIESAKLVDPSYQEKLAQGIVKASSLNIRSGYGTNYPKIGSLSNKYQHLKFR